MVMKYDEFAARLEELRAEFESVNGRRPETMAEFDDFLRKKKLGRVRTGTLRSLKGFGI